MVRRLRVWHGLVLACWMWLPMWAGAATDVGQDALSVVDDRGAQVVLKQAPQRIISLLPSLTEAVCVLGACERLVATDRWSNWPASVGRLPKVGGLDDPQIESIVAYKPDLVLASSSSRLAQRLRSLGLTVAEFEAQTLDDVPRVLAAVAVLLGRPGAEGPVWQGVKAELVAAQTAVPASVKGQRVYFEVAATPYAAGEVSFIGQLLIRLGVRNVVPAKMGPFPKLNPEFVVRADPDLIILAADEAAGLAKRPGWAGMRAIKGAAVCGLVSKDYDLLARPGPRLGQAAGVLATCLRLQAARLAGARP